MLIIFMPVHNEMARYLRPCLRWARERADEIFVWDDNSTDGGRDVALGMDAWVASRKSETATFLMAEGEFRRAGWDYMIRTLNPTENDWIFALDADEFPVGAPPAGVARAAELAGRSSVVMEVPEIFSLAPLSRRVDGYWGEITQVRMVRFQPDKPQDFRKSGMGCGSLPSYAYDNPYFTQKMQLLHFGYAKQEDREHKHRRYMRAKHGHAPSHINSIIEPATLVPWEGEVPVWDSPLPHMAKTS